MTTSPALFPAALLAAAEHDLRGLLNTLRLGADTLELTVGDGPARRAAEIVARTTATLQATLEDLIATAAGLAEGETGMTAVDLDALLRDVTAQHGVPVHAPTDRRARMVEANAVVVRHLLMHLVSNAVGTSEPAAVRVWTRRRTDGVRVLVSHPVVPGTVAELPANATSVDLSSSGRGRGLTIVEILARAAGITHESTTRNGLFVTRLVFPRPIGHPSTVSRRSTGQAPGVVLHLDAFDAGAGSGGVPPRGIVP